MTLAPRPTHFLRRAAVRRVGLAACLVALASVTACVHVFWRTEARSIPRASVADTSITVVRAAVKAHLRDGTTVVYRRGVAVGRGALAGNGEAYALLARVPVPRTAAVPLDSVVGLETFEGRVLAAPTVVASLGATVLGALGAAALAVAIFGSCPTVYADTGTGPVLEAEGFSYAVAPLMEQRDLDPLRVRPGADGIVRLELRNEALETHYINQIALTVARHPAGSRVVPDQRGRPVVVAALRPVSRATDRAGRDVREQLGAVDGRVFASDSAMIERARPDDLDDWIDVAADNLPPGDSVAVVLRLRNSLLNTVLLYEGILGGRDAPDWLGGQMQRIAGAVELGRWYTRTMGMRATVDGLPLPTGADHRVGHARMGDVGPIAFRDVALVLPRAARDARSVRVRLRFVADNWRVDRAEIAAAVARPAVREVAVAHVVVPTPAEGAGPVLDTAAVGSLAEPDDRYLVTRPGQRMTLVFEAGAPRAAPTADTATTYLIAWQGWYSEWIRGEWLARPTRTTPFVAGDSAVHTALRRWRSQRRAMESAFYATRLPVR